MIPSVNQVPPYLGQTLHYLKTPSTHDLKQNNTHALNINFSLKLFCHTEVKLLIVKWHLFIDKNPENLQIFYISKV